MAENTTTTVSVKLLRPVYAAPGARPLPIGTVMGVDAATAAFWIARKIAIRADAEAAEVKLVTGGADVGATLAPMPPAPPLKDPAASAPKPPS